MLSVIAAYPGSPTCLHLPPSSSSPHSSLFIFPRLSSLPFHLPLNLSSPRFTCHDSSSTHQLPSLPFFLSRSPSLMKHQVCLGNLDLLILTTNVPRCENPLLNCPFSFSRLPLHRSLRYHNDDPTRCPEPYLQPCRLSSAASRTSRPSRRRGKCRFDTSSLGCHKDFEG